VALPDYFTNELGTPIVWGTPSGSGVTKNMTLNNLASGSGRMGVYADLGANWYGQALLDIAVETGTAPTAETVFEVWLAWSLDGTTWPGKVDGTDGAFPATVSVNKQQLDGPYFLVCSADTNTTVRQASQLIEVKGRYVAPVAVNLLGQSLRNQGTPADNASRVTITPVRSVVQDAA
jgi:hypothetical protein